MLNVSINLKKIYLIDYKNKLNYFDSYAMRPATFVKKTEKN
jgi:hypothetical protein